MEIKPITLKEANAFVAKHHRHSNPTLSWKFGVGLWNDGALVGVGLAGRPLARMADDGQTLEILRVCTTDAPNGCSMIYGALRNAAKALGYTRVLTYTLERETGSSLRASGFRTSGTVAAASWSRSNRPRDDKHSLEPRLRWEWP